MRYRVELTYVFESEAASPEEAIEDVTYLIESREYRMATKRPGEGQVSAVAKPLVTE